MAEANHPDEVELLRIALWGDAAERTAPGAARHVESCAVCSADVAYHRRVRDMFRRWAESRPSPGAMALAQQSALAPDDPAAFDWIAAVPVGACEGVRSGMPGDVHVVAGAGEIVLEVVLQSVGRHGGFSVSGEATHADASPAADVDVTLFVDRLPVAGMGTDAFGEFAFGSFTGERWGLRVRSGADASYVEILPGAGGR